MALTRWLRDARLSLALLGPLGGLRSVPATPALTVRDLWTGDEAQGELLVRGSGSHGGVTRTLNHGRWSAPDWPDDFRAWVQGFTWLRDLRELGTESARTKARAMVATWMGQPIGETPLQDAAATGARIAAWLGQYDFFAASADSDFRKTMMTRIVLEARTIMALLPGDNADWRSLQALKGLLAAAIALPTQPAFLARFMKQIDPELERQVLPDGCHASRSPEAQLLVLRELAEMRVMLQTARIPIPTTLAAALDRMTPVLRALRHADGRLALFNGARTHRPARIEAIIARALPRGQVVARNLPEGRIIRVPLGNTTLFVDGGAPPPAAFDGLTHAGALSFEMSSGRSQIIVNCGGSTLPGWREALRDASAHSVLSLSSMPALRWSRSGALESRPTVTCEHTIVNADHLLELSSSAYGAVGAGLYRRRLYLSQDGADLRGEDRFDGEGAAPDYALRFHLHPEVRVELEETDILLLTQDETWRFRSDGYASIEESVYFGTTTPTKTLQIVVHPRDLAEATGVAAESEEPETQPVALDDAGIGEEEDASETVAPLHHDYDEQPSAYTMEPSDHTEDEVTDVAGVGVEPESHSENIHTPEGENYTSEVGEAPPLQDIVNEHTEEQPPAETALPSGVAHSIRWAFTRLDG